MNALLHAALLLPADDGPGAVHTVVLDASGINQLSTARAASALKEFARSYAQRYIRLFIACAKGPVRDVFERPRAADSRRSAVD